MAIKNANTAIYDKQVDRAAMIRLYEQKVAKKVVTVINGHEVRISDIIAANKAKMSDKLREEIDQEIKKSFVELHNVTSRSLLDLVTDQISYTYQTIETTIGKLWKSEKPMQRVAEDIVLQRPIYSDKTLLAGWTDLSISERKRIEQVIRKGIADGMTESDIALQIRKGNVFNITRNQSLGLARTAMTSVQAQADNEVYKANKDALRGWQYVAVLDSRTTPLCAHRDGNIYALDDTVHLPPAHWYCRSTTVPVVKSYADLAKLEGIDRIRKRNFEGLTPKQIAYYDGQTPLKESYSEWLFRQPLDVQLKHLGDNNRVEMFQSGQLTLDKFTVDGRAIGIKELRRMTDSGYGAEGDTRRFAMAKEKLDNIKLWATRPDDIINDVDLQKALKDYYILQAGDLDGMLSYTNYRGALLHTKKATRQRVLNSPPTEENLKFNPMTNRYEDSRMYQPNPAVLENNLRLLRESPDLKQVDKDFIEKFVNDLENRMGVNERAVIADNLRIVFTRFRKNAEPWGNFKAVLNSQIKFDVMNVSDYMETQLRRDQNIWQRLKQLEYVDAVLGPTELQDLHDTFLDNIFSMRKWEYNQAPKLARRLRNVLDLKIPFKIRNRLEDADLEDFYLRFAKRLAFADTPDRDQFAISLGRDLYNAANYRGSRNEWYKLGVKILDDAKDKGIYKLETYGVQKRRMKSRNGGRYFGPYYDTFAVNIRIVDQNILDYAKLVRKVDVGLRVGVTTGKNRLKFREGYKTYFTQDNRDTGIPIISADSFRDFPSEFMDKNMVDALNWAANTEFKIDKDYYDAISKILFFRDDKGKAAFYDGLNQYKKYIAGRGDTYERFKAMEWLSKSDKAFSNHPFLDHRGRIYERGFIGPQAGETFRPFLNTATPKKFSVDEFYNLQDQIGSFLGGLSDKLEGNFNGLSVLGRQKIAEKWRKELVDIGNAMRRGKPNDIRRILESNLMAEIDGEEQGKALRFAIEVAKIDEYLKGNYSKANLVKLEDYKISLALEQDASSSGAQIIALTTKNKQLAELSNVIPTNQKKRLYDEIAAATYNDPRFRKLNEKLGLTEKDLRKAAKAQNMVTLYGAGERTGIMNVEGKLAKVLDKEDGRLVVKASDRDTVLNEISARAARYKELDPELYEELMALRQDVKDVFNKGLNPGDDIMEQLWFLDPKTRDLVEKMTRNYESVVTPDDFSIIAGIMSENLRSQVPILKDFTKFFGRLAEEFALTSKPGEASFDWKAIAKESTLGNRFLGKKPDKRIAEILGIDPNTTWTEKLLKRFDWWKPNSTMADLLFGAKQAQYRRTGTTVFGVDVLYPNELPKNWTQIPWVNFDGKIIEQKFTQSFEERLRYKTAEGEWITNIIQVKQKTDPTWWDEVLNKSGKMNEIVNATKARTAYAVNGNHSNDATLVKQFHLWGKKNNVGTSTIHDAFFTNAADLLKAKEALRKIYANTLTKNVVKDTLDEMLKRGLPREAYDRYLNEAIDIGLIPVAGRSRIGGKLVTEADILTAESILENLPRDFTSNRSWYGIGG